MELIEVHSPASGQKIGEVAATTVEGARRAIDRARAAQRRWEALHVEQRARVIARFKDVLLDRADDVSRLLSLENGKVLQESFQMEVFPVVDLSRYFAERAAEILGSRRIPLHLLKHRRSTIHYRPRGVVLVIAPYNYPFAIPFGEAVMALLAGNAVVLKPSLFTPLIALKGRELFDAAGLDPDLLLVLPASARVTAAMIDMGVSYVNFTGSTATGRRVAEVCGRNLIPCTLELGGKDAAVVLPDADLDLVTGSLVWGAFANAGQTCASIERVYVHESIHDEVVRRVVARTSALRVGDPLADGTDMGPMTDPAQLDVVTSQVRQAVAEGARVLAGGRRMEGSGQFYLPTVLVDVKDEMQIVEEETFGPTLPILRYRTVEEAIERANASVYGLDAYVYGRDRRQTQHVAQRLNAGTVMVNEALITHAAPETPWGGVKHSGVGRVHAAEGLRGLCETYHVNDEAIRAPAWSPFWQPYSHRTYRALVGVARVLAHSRWGGRAQGAWSVLGGVCDGARRRQRQAD